MDTSQLNKEDRQILRVSLAKTAEVAMQQAALYGDPKKAHGDPRAPMLAREAHRFGTRAMQLFAMIEP